MESDLGEIGSGKEYESSLKRRSKMCKPKVKAKYAGSFKYTTR